MKTRAFTHPLAALAGALLLALPALGWAAPPFNPPPKGGLPACQKALVACQAELSACEESSFQMPGDGWPEDAYPSGGVPLSYTDNGDGTFTDDNTGLMWEIKDGADGVPNYTNPHDVDNLFTWTAEDEEPFIFNGTAETEFLAELNAGTGFAGYKDWRLPTIKELQSLVDYSVPYPGPTVAAGLPGATAAADYWSSTSFAGLDDVAWYLLFDLG